MTRIIFSFTLIALVSLASCTSDQRSDAGDNTQIDSLLSENTDQSPMDTVESAPPPPPPPPSPEKTKIQDDLALKSPFLKLGCCNDKGKREDQCCCEEVLKLFTEMYNANDIKLAELAMSDPILGPCKRAMPEAFNAVENTSDTLNLDDLYD